MKKIIVLILVFLIVGNTFSQKSLIQTQTKEFYLKKSKNQYTTGCVLLIGGTAMIIGGFISDSQKSDPDPIDPDGYSFGSYLSASIEQANMDIGAAGYFIIGGVLADLASIPFFISSSKNKKKAASISFSYQNIYFKQNNLSSLSVKPSIVIRIKF